MTRSISSLLAVLMILMGASSISCVVKKPMAKVQVVEASCGQCQFHMTEKTGCDLAVRIDEKPYFVDGTTIDQHGDPHAKDGFCNAIRRAEVSGEVKEGRFKAKSFELVK